MKRVISLLGCVAVLQAFDADAQTYTLADGNSSITLDPGSSAGMNSWMVDGQNQLNQQLFFYRVGNSGPASTIDNISAPVVSQPDPYTLITTYENSQSQFRLNVVYSLLGGAAGSGTSDLGEQIRIQNLAGSTLPFHFFQYADFNINDAVVQLGRNVRKLYNEALVTSANASVSESVDSGIAPGANRGEAALFGQTLTSLMTIPNYQLDNNTSAGPGHATWAFEWDVNLAANGTLIISKDINISGVVSVPESAGWLVAPFGIAVVGLFAQGRRRA